MCHRNFDILKILSNYGITYKKVGSHYVTHCLFHRDKNPSMVLYEDTSSFFCFACNTGGGIEKLIAKIENISIKEAFKKLYGNNYEFNSLSNGIEELEPDNKYMLDRLALKIKSKARQDKEFIKQVPDLISNILFSEMTLLKFNDLINKLNKESLCR